MSTQTPQFSEYVAYANARERRRRRELGEQKDRAWGMARLAAQVLKKRFGAKRVFLFGSLATGVGFGARSDIDLALVGPLAGRFFGAVAAVLAATDEFEIDLVDLDDCPEELRQQIVTEGVEL